MLYCTQ